jgi:hypothetical protein
MLESCRGTTVSALRIRLRKPLEHSRTCFAVNFWIPYQKVLKKYQRRFDLSLEARKGINMYRSRAFPL